MSIRSLLKTLRRRMTPPGNRLPKDEGYGLHNSDGAHTQSPGAVLPPAEHR